MVRDHRSASTIRNHRREPQEAVWGGLLCVSRRPYPHFLLRQWRHRPTRGRPRGAPAPGAQAIILTAVSRSCIRIQYMIVFLCCCFASPLEISLDVSRSMGRVGVNLFANMFL